MPGMNEAVLLVTVFAASYYLHPVSIWCYQVVNHWLLATIVYLGLMVLLFTPSMLVSSFLDCRYRSLIFLVGLVTGSLLYKLIDRYRHKQ